MKTKLLDKIYRLSFYYLFNNIHMKTRKLKCNKILLNNYIFSCIHFIDKNELMFYNINAEIFILRGQLCKIV